MQSSVHINGGIVMYSVLRLIIGCVFLGCSIVIIKRSKVVRKRILYIVATGISVVLITVLAFLPFENLFLTFGSYKTAYQYYNFGKSNIELVVEGNSCDLIVDRKNDSDVHLIIPKTTNGWKIGIGSNTRKIIQKTTNGITICIYQYKNTNDYFITIIDTNGEKLEVSDNYNTRFYSLEKNNYFIEKTVITYYAHISNLNPQYSIIVNGNEIELGNETD